MSSRKDDERKSLTAARKLDRDREASLAMREYQAEKARVDANTVRLRALRLAKEAADAQTVAPAKEKPETRPSKARQPGRKTRKSA
jgi:hypothetical protein